MTPTINSHNNWSRLEEVWLGDVYPESWYDHLPSEIRDCFYEITQRTKEDLNYIQKLLESFGVRVCRPTYTCIDDYVNPGTGQLIKPEICPRDVYLVTDNRLFAKKNKINPWQEHIDRYVAHGGTVEPILQKMELCLNSASTVRAGKDLYFDLVWILNSEARHHQVSKEYIIDYFKSNFAHYFKDYRVHLLFNGGHVDSCFALLKPGQILGNRYFDDYATTFPNWKILMIHHPEFYHHTRHRDPNVPWKNCKWWMPDFKYNQAFNNHVIEHAQTWVGNYTETYFEVNCLVVDEQNVIIPGENSKVFDILKKRGITAHPVPFRTRTFWDGGMHCITLDIRRQSTMEDFFPERSEQPLTIYE